MPITVARLKPAFAYIFLCVVILLAYAGVYDNQFVFDDEFLVQKNRFLRGWEFLGSIFTTNSTAGFGGIDSFYRPLQIFLYLITYQLFGLSLTAFHALNVALHALNACLAFRLSQRLGFHKGMALVACLVWALHPIHTEAVTYISATADPLHVTFILCGLLVFIGTPAKPYGTALCFILALLSKEAAIVFPALLCVILFLQNERRWQIKTYTPTLPYWVIALAYLGLRASLLNFDNSFNFYKTANIYTDNILVRIYTALATLPDYFSLLVAPHDLHMERITKIYVSFFDPSVLWGAGIVILLIATLVHDYVRSRRTQAYLVNPALYAVLWFFACFFPLSGVAVPMNAVFLEHWMYLPSLGLFLGMSESISHFIKNKTPLYAGAAILGALFGFLTFQQNGTWQTPMIFYNHILQFEEGSARLHNNLAMAYSDENRHDDAQRHYEKAIALQDTYPQTRYNLGLLLLEKGNLDAAISHFKRALALDPSFFYAASQLAQITAQQGQTAETNHYLQIYHDGRAKRLGR